MMCNIFESIPDMVHLALLSFLDEEVLYLPKESYIRAGKPSACGVVLFGVNTSTNQFGLYKFVLKVCYATLYRM